MQSFCNWAQLRQTDGGCPFPNKVPVNLQKLQKSSDEELMEYLRQGQNDALSILFDRIIGWFLVWLFVSFGIMAKQRI